jgi:hypothetical protein
MGYDGMFHEINHVSYLLELVGGCPSPLKNDGLRQWGWDDIPYMKWKIKFHGSKPPTSKPIFGIYS